MFVWVSAKSISFFLAGKYGSEIRPAFWLNFLFLLMPVLGAVTLFTRPKDRPLIGGYNVSLMHEWLDLDMNAERFRAAFSECFLIKIHQNTNVILDPVCER